MDHLFHLYCFKPFRRNDGAEAKWSCGLWLGMYLKEVGFGEDLLLPSLTSGKRCIAGKRDNAFPPCSNGLQTTNYLPHVTRSLRTNCMGIHKFLQNYKVKRSIKRRPCSSRSTKVMAAVKVFITGKWGAWRSSSNGEEWSRAAERGRAQMSSIPATSLLS